MNVFTSLRWTGISLVLLGVDKLIMAQRQPMAKMVASFLEEGNSNSLRAQKSSSSSIQMSPSASTRSFGVIHAVMDEVMQNSLYSDTNIHYSDSKEQH